MNTNYHYLLKLLRAFINEEVPDIPKDVNWKELMEIAHIHSVDGIAGYMIKKYDLAQNDAVKKAARELCHTAIALYNKRAALMEQLVCKMNQEHISHILFKGYIIKDYYPVPELRSYGDVDFVIYPDDRNKMHELLINDGFQVKTDWEPVYSYLKGIEYYEVHTDIMEIDISQKADYKGYFKRMWKHTIKTADFSYQFTPEYHFIYLLTHIAKHIYGSGAGIRMYMDIAAFIKRLGNEINWNFVIQELRSLELYNFACTVFSAVRVWFGIELPMSVKDVPTEVMEEFFEFTMEAGTFGYVNREQGVHTLRKEIDAEKGVSRISIIIKKLFPKASDIEKRYTYLSGRHWLLPAAWAHRFFRTSNTWKKHSHEAYVIMSAKTDEAERLNKIHRDIGL